MDEYEIKVTDERWRPVDKAMIQWELAGRRPVRVWALHNGRPPYPSGRYDTLAQAEVKIFEDDESGIEHAVIAMPVNGTSGGMRAELIPAFMEVLARASAIAAAANERIRAEVERAERLAAEAERAAVEARAL